MKLAHLSRYFERWLYWVDRCRALLIRKTSHAEYVLVKRMIREKLTEDRQERGRCTDLGQQHGVRSAAEPRPANSCLRGQRRQLNPREKLCNSRGAARRDTPQAASHAPTHQTRSLERPDVVRDPGGRGQPQLVKEVADGAWTELAAVGACLNEPR